MKDEGKGSRHRRRQVLMWDVICLASLLLVASCTTEKDVSDAGMDGGTDGGAALSRLRANLTKIVDSSGNQVILRGVNLGGWMFHETWITLVDYATHGRVLKLAAAEGLQTEAVEAMKEAGISYGDNPGDVHVCPANGGKWLEGFETFFKKRVGNAKSSDFMSKLAQYPSICDDADLPLRALLEKRFGLAGRDELIDAFQKAWLAEGDIKWLSEQGFNVVRVPIGYRNITSMPDAEKPQELIWNPMAFARIDELLNWCEKHGVYAVIDMQEVPGGQNTYAGKSYLWDDPKMQELTVQLWEYLSDRYKNRNIVAAYSLMAEPYGAPDADARDAMYDKLVKAIRKRGDDHLLVIHDGFFGMGSLPKPSKYGWSGVVYSTHLFEWALTGLDEYENIISYYDDLFSSAQKDQAVPYYIGSFSTFKDEGWAYEAAGKLAGWFEKRRYSWSLWTFKRIDDPVTKELFGFTTQWGLLGRLESALDRPDIYLDDRETITAKFGAYKDLKIAANESLLAQLKKR